MKERAGQLQREQTTPLMVSVTWLQCKNMLWHIERMVKWAKDLAARGGKKAVDPSMGSPKMEIRKFANSYSQLLEVILELTRMEEKVLFPIFDMADRKLLEAAERRATKITTMQAMHVARPHRCVWLRTSFAGVPGASDPTRGYGSDNRRWCRCFLVFSRRRLGPLPP